MSVLDIIEYIGNLIITNSVGNTDWGIGAKIVFILISLYYVTLAFKGYKMLGQLRRSIGFIAGMLLAYIIGLVSNNELIIILGVLPLGISISTLSEHVKTVGNGILTGIVPAVLLWITFGWVQGLIGFIILYLIGMILPDIAVTAIISLVCGVLSMQILFMCIPALYSWITVSIFGFIVGTVGFVVQCIILLKQATIHRNTN